MTVIYKLICVILEIKAKKHEKLLGYEGIIELSLHIMRNINKNNNIIPVDLCRE